MFSSYVWTIWGEMLDDLRIELSAISLLASLKFSVRSERGLMVPHCLELRVLLGIIAFGGLFDL